jgi:hypothetical protein
MNGRMHAPRAPLSGWLPVALAITLWLLLGIAGVLQAGEGRIFRCATSEDVHRALEAAGPGDTILLEGGRVYETAESFMLENSGTAEANIRFTSEDPSGQGRYAVISTVGERKEPNLTAVRVRGAYWHISRIEITGRRVPLEDGYWDTHGFQLGLYLQGAESHHNLVEDVEVHDTHNAAVAVRDDAHHNTFRRMRIHHIGEWLGVDYNAHEAEGFYLGSSKGVAEAGNRARIHHVLIEDSVIGPGLLGQFVDIKYGASYVTVRNNVFHCNEKAYNQEIILLAGYASRVENNEFVGSNENLEHYIRVNDYPATDPVRVDYMGEVNIPSPTGRDNVVVNNVFRTNDTGLPAVVNDIDAPYRTSLVVEGNRIEPLEE